jgi:salicylate synthetase
MTLLNPTSLTGKEAFDRTEIIGRPFARPTYYEYQIPYPADPVTFLRNALRFGLLSKDYILYSGRPSHRRPLQRTEGYQEPDDEIMIAGNPVARLTVDADTITFDYQGKSQRTPVHDPFAQIPTILAELPIQNWRAYGYVGFDVSRFYYSYHKAIDYPILSFFVPSFEARLSSQGVTVRSLQPVGDLEALFRNQTNGGHHYKVTTPSIDLAEQHVYQERVADLIGAIQRGELHKAIISRSVKLQGNMDLIGTYALSATHNTAARSYCMSLGDVRTVGFSPEILMAVDAKGYVMTNPLAATRRRGATPEEDQALYNELFTDAKEVKEHALSIWLAQSEIESVCGEGAARIFDFMEVKKYRTVQHLSSRAGGQLKPGYTLWDGLRALFPGITVSGIDKAAAIAWIDRLEDEPRGLYAGGIGWIDSNGSADLAIALRSIFQYGDDIIFRAGAGIVGESKPDFEYMETVNKMKTMLNYLVMA